MRDIKMTYILSKQLMHHHSFHVW